jgi:hypothetical protein
MNETSAALAILMRLIPTESTLFMSLTLTVQDSLRYILVEEGNITT